MVYIPFPRIDLNNDADLAVWRANNNKNEGDWTSLKDFLAKQPRLIAGTDLTPKCWYSECLQLDNYALDVEHFRPKNQASPLTEKHIKAIKKQTDFIVRQANTNGSYSWLEFDYRNYRLVTALTNRGGAKHIYFPIAENSIRLGDATFPWDVDEFLIFLDPTNAHDASLLLVLQTGEIVPRAPKTEFRDSDFVNIVQNWKSDAFNYMRASVTIYLYRLNDRVFREARQEKYAFVNEIMRRLQDCFPANTARFRNLRDGFIKDLTLAALPSAPFALAVRSALEAYIPPTDIHSSLQQALAPIPRKILDKIAQQVNGYITTWQNT